MNKGGSTKLSGEASARLDLLRFPLIVGVVFIHANATTVSLANSELGVSDPGWLSHLVRTFLSDGLARVAVPLFYLISGYLFFFGFEWCWRAYGRKLASRARSLLVPYLFWNLLVLGLYGVAMALPATRGLLTDRWDALRDGGLWVWLSAWLGLGEMPIAYQFWFIRDLIVMVLLAPVVYGLLRLTRGWVLAPLLAAWLAAWWPVPIPAAEACVFFCAGAWVGLSRRDLFELDRFAVPIAAVYAGLLVADVWLHARDTLRPLHHADIAVGVAFALCCSRELLRRERLRMVLTALGGASFFVFAVHEPTLTLMRKLAYRELAPVGDGLALLLFFVTPVLTIALALAAHAGLKRVAPGFLAWVSGGR